MLTTKSETILGRSLWAELKFPHTALEIFDLGPLNHQIPALPEKVLISAGG